MNKNEIIRFFRLHEEDYESICVEIGLLSNRIISIENQLKKLLDEEDPNFFARRLELIQTTRSRRKLLQLLKSTNTEIYNKIMIKIKRWEEVMYPHDSKYSFLGFKYRKQKCHTK